MTNILMSGLTIMSLIFIAYLLSSSKKDINWRTVLFGLIGQFIIVIFLLKVPIGQKLLEFIALSFQNIIDYGVEGVEFVFGDLSSVYYSFALSVLALVVFTSSLVSVLYFLKVIPFLINTIGNIVAKFLHCSKVESMSVVANSFLSGNESLLVIKPYLPCLTKSEFFAAIAGGFSSASVGILGGYSLMMGEGSMKYLLLAVFTVPMSCLMFAKLLVPEVETSVLADVKSVKSEDSNIFEAISSGAMNGLNIVLGVGASLIAFVGLVSLLDGILGIIGLSFSTVLSWVFYPVGLLLNIPISELTEFTTVLGIKTGVNEFVAFTRLSEAMHTLSPRTIAILTVTSTNFCNFSVIAILTAGISAMCPERKSEMSKIGLKALVCGLLATLSTGAIVGMIF